MNRVPPRARRPRSGPARTPPPQYGSGHRRPALFLGALPLIALAVAGAGPPTQAEAAHLEISGPRTFAVAEGATVTAFAPRVAAGEPAHSYTVTLAAEGERPISFALLAGEPCAADGTPFSEVPPEFWIPARSCRP